MRITPSVGDHQRRKKNAGHRTSGQQGQAYPPLDHLFASIFTSLSSNKANKNAPISYFSLIDRVTLSKNATDYTFYNGRSLATYPTISIQPIIGGYFRQGVVIPRVHFNNPATGRFSLGYYSGGEQVEIVIAYVDDDKINMKYNATGTFTVEMIIDGLVNGSA